MENMEIKTSKPAEKTEVDGKSSVWGYYQKHYRSSLSTFREQIRADISPLRVYEIKGGPKKPSKSRQEGKTSFALTQL